MKITKAVLGLLFFSLFVLQCKQHSTTILSVSDFSDKIKFLPNAPIIDVRTPDEFAKGHLPNAQNIDWNNENFETEIQKINHKYPVFVYCLSGGRSSNAVQKMYVLGFDSCIEMQGGIIKWRASNLPETTNVTVQNNGITSTEFENLVQSNKLVLIDFYADWCAPCKKMKPYLEEISNENKNIKVIRINADDNQNLCKDLKIDALPVLLFYKNNSLVWQHQGFISKEEVLKNLN